ncbi:fam-m protein [Plasmodium malariae]|uniref:Fam-m protein n=1 Tax=Plasmodium malariae TaxID=5858 RepID=A0A1D3JHT2_PLAMA|nr:fam-m protein [Plasmodium malariae]SBT85981.1 fam-m protein [Plasmodium malariae]
MEKKINSIKFIKLSVFLFLNLIFHLNNDVSIISKSVDDNFYLGRKLDTRYYRSLSKYKQDKDSNNICLGERFSNNGVNERRDILNDEKVVKKKNQQLKRSSLNNAQYFTEIVDYNKGMFDGKHFHFEKKWIKKKDYDHFLEKNRRIRDISLKKIGFRDYGFAVIIIFILLLLGIGYPILLGLRHLNTVGEKIKELLEGVSIIDSSTGIPSYTYVLSFAVSIVILSIIIIIAMTKILKNNEKYNKIKLIYG